MAAQYNRYMADDGELAELLSALCSAEQVTRSGAEDALARGRTQLGFPTRLAAFASKGPSVADTFPLRQLALTILKRLAVEKWAEVTCQDRLAVKQSLAAALAEENRNLRGLLHVCVAHVRLHEDWQELNTQLAMGLSQGSAREAECCVECIVTLLEECGLDVALALAPLQEPMLRHASSESSPPSLRRQCTNGFVAVAQALEKSSEAAFSSVAARVSDWLAVCVMLCAGLAAWSDADRLVCATTATRAVATLSTIALLEQELASHLGTVLQPMCHLLLSLSPAYERMVIHVDDHGASEDEDGVATFVVQFLELLKEVLGRSKLRELLKGKVKDLLQLTIPFMRITEVQISRWQADPNEFLAHEDGEHAPGCQIRVAGESLISALSSQLKSEAQQAVAVLTGELLEEGERGRTAGEAGLWKLTEVALIVFTSAAMDLPVKALQPGSSGFGIRSRTTSIAAIVPKVLGAACVLCADSSVPELLRARSFSTLKQLSSAVCALSSADIPNILRAAAAGMLPSEVLVVRVSACRAFCKFLPATADVALKEALLLECGVLASLGDLLHHANEELLNMTLELLCLVIKQCPGTMAAVEASLSPLVLNLWQRSKGDHLTRLQVLDVVSSTTGADPVLQRSMELHLLPAVSESLRPEAEEYAAASAIELLEVLLRRAAVPLDAKLWSCVELALAAAMRSSDSMLMENSCDMLCMLVKRTPRQIIDRGLLESLLRCVDRFLGPDLDDDACGFVGPFVTLLLSHFGSAFSVDLRGALLRALVARLARAERRHLQQELIVVLVRFLHEDLPGILATLSEMQIILPAGQAQNALDLFLGIWLSCSSDIRAKSARSVTISALCKLHAHCKEDAQLAALQVGRDSRAPFPLLLLGAIVGALEYENERCRKFKDGLEREELDGEDQPELQGDEAANEDDEDELSDGDADAGCAVPETQGQPHDALATLDIRRISLEYLAANVSCVASVPELAQRISAAVAEASGNSCGT